MLLLAQDAAARAAELLHVPAHAEHQPQVHAQRADIRARLAAHAEDAEVPLLVVPGQGEVRVRARVRARVSVRARVKARVRARARARARVRVRLRVRVR